MCFCSTLGRCVLVPTLTNIQRVFNGRGGYVDSNKTSTIIGEIVNEFENVAAIAGIEVKK